MLAPPRGQIGSVQREGATAGLCGPGVVFSFGTPPLQSVRPGCIQREEGRELRLSISAPDKEGNKESFNHSIKPGK